VIPRSAEGIRKSERVSDAIDKDIKRNPKSARTIFCSKGCSHCCKVPVNISDEEAESLVKHCEEIAFKIDTELLKRQANAGADRWRQLKKEDQSCVFLNRSSGVCEVYVHRPNSCRQTLVRNTNEYCLPSTKREADIFNSPYGAILTTASKNVGGNGLLPKALLNQIRWIL